MNKEEFISKVSTKPTSEEMDYRAVWENKISALVVNDTDIVEDELLLEYKSTAAPLMYVTKIKLYKNGLIALYTNSMFDPEEELVAQLLPESLTEIKRLVNEEEMQKQGSCRVVARDGINSDLSLYGDRHFKLITNSNCSMNDFGFSYRCLIFLLTAIKQTINSNKN